MVYLLRACQAFMGVREKASRYPNTLCMLMSTLDRTRGVWCDQYTAKTRSHKKHVFDPNNNPWSVKPPEGSAFGPVDI
jgi:hypothetical protein